MAGSQQRRTPVEPWSLAQAATWVETRVDPSDQPIHRPIASAAVEELHEALKAGAITGSGCVDGVERRKISPAEWHDYRLTLKQVTFADHHYMGSPGVPVIAVSSIRSFPAGALKHHGYKSGVQIPSAQSPHGQPGYHRVIDDVLLRRKEIWLCAAGAILTTMQLCRWLYATSKGSPSGSIAPSLSSITQGRAESPVARRLSAGPPPSLIWHGAQSCP